MITTIKKFKTSDGKVHDRMCDAVKHQECIDEEQKQSECKFEQFFDFLNIGYQIKREELKDRLKENIPLLKALANSF